MKIEAKEIVKTYQDKSVLTLKGTHHHLVFEPGKIYGIIGPNGSGKTTLLKIMAGLIPMSSGNMLYNNQSLTHQTMTEMTYSSHSPTLFSRSIYENIAYPLRIRKVDKQMIDDTVNGLLAEFELNKIQTQNAKHLSGGESQKTALARALSFSPKVLFLDEPTANIDPKSIRIIESALKKRNHHDNLTVIIITHNLSQAFRLCSHLIFMDQGQCLFSGTPEEIMATSDPIINDFISYNRF
ncbi:MAG: ABC transporter ATP-binding protein [Acetobacterium woodii]|nr:ABC transporter ATP-binding protein [Acetobacterium woodii]